MLLVKGKIKEDAVLRKVNGKDVVAFTVEHMERSYKNGDPVKLFTYWDCSYWEVPNSVTVLKKGRAIDVFGSVDIYAFMHEGKARVGIRMMVKAFEFLPSNDLQKGTDESDAVSGAEDANDDLPF